jgi:hypothetical protein
MGDLAWVLAVFATGGLVGCGDHHQAASGAAARGGSGASTTASGGRAGADGGAAGTGGQPNGWLCAADRYGTGNGCDCGCGIPDPDCRSSSAEECNDCSLPGSCAAGSPWTCTAIDRSDNTRCAGGVPAGWTCAPAYHGSGDGCDCGCGVRDPDCASAAAGVCEHCEDRGACSSNYGCAHILGSDNARCDFTAPAGWNCPSEYYGRADGCDCGCGLRDPDCADDTSARCETCALPGSCANTCSSIDPNRNATCS